jgi:hypothetical protein
VANGFGSAGGVPALRERNQRPRGSIVVSSAWRRIKALGLDHEIILRDWRNGRLHGFQQQIVFNFAHRALRVPEAMISKVFCAQIERIVRILSIRRPRQSWLLKC